MKKIISLLFVLLSVFSFAETNNSFSTKSILKKANTTIYYSKAKGSLNDLTTWGKNKDGSGEQPKSFTDDNINYYLANGNVRLTKSWSVGGQNSSLVIGAENQTLNFTLLAGTTLTCDLIYLKAANLLTIQGVLSAGKLICEQNSSVFYLGTENQNIIPADYYNLSLKGGNKVMSGNISVSNSFEMAASVYTGSSILTLGINAKNIGTLKYISGNIIGKFNRWFAASITKNLSGLFPVGTTDFYRSMNIEYTSSPKVGGTILVEFISKNPGTSGLPLIEDGATLDKGASDGYWKVTTSNGLTGGVYTASVTASNFIGIKDITQLRMLCRTAGIWTTQGTSQPTTGEINAPVITRSNLPTGNIEIGVSKEVINPLPVKLIILSVQQESDNAILTWKTASEQSSSHFEIERSIDNLTWETIGDVKAAGHSNDVRSYIYTDYIKEFFQQNVLTVYYRLNQVDIDQTSTHSNIITLDLIPSSDQIIVYPLPFDNILTVATQSGSPIKDIVILDMTGKEVISTRVSHIDVSTVATGMYLIRVATDKEIYYQKISK